MGLILPSGNPYNQKVKRLQEPKMTQFTPIEATSDTVECEKCGLTFKAKGIKKHQTLLLLFLFPISLTVQYYNNCNLTFTTIFIHLCLPQRH